MTDTVGYAAMVERLNEAGHTASVEHTGGGVMTVYAYFADGTAVAMLDDGAGDWAWCLEVAADGEILDQSVGETTNGGDMAGIVARLEAAHGGPLARAIKA